MLLRKNFTLSLIGAVVLAMLGFMSVSYSTLAAGAECTVDPTHGTPGTVFHFSCSGFPADAGASIYVVEPDGLASSGGWNLQVPYSVDTKQGSFAFTWASWSNTRYSQAFGKYAWVIQLPNGSAQATVDTFIDRVDYAVSGATLDVSPKRASDIFWFTGTGFAPNEIVSIWVTLPPNCSSAQSAGEFAAVHPGDGFGQQGIYDAPDPKADAAGNIYFPIQVYYHACRGEYALTARALASGNGASATFEVTGNSVETNASLYVTPDVVDATNPVVTIYGFGFGANQTVNCWFTRPDGRTTFSGSASSDTKAAADGSINFTTIAGDSTYANFVFPHASAEEPGQWSVSCRAPGSNATGIAEFRIGTGGSTEIGLSPLVPIVSAAGSASGAQPSHSTLARLPLDP